MKNRILIDESEKRRIMGLHSNLRPTIMEAAFGTIMPDITKAKIDQLRMIAGFEPSASNLSQEDINKLYDLLMAAPNAPKSTVSPGHTANK